MEWAKRVTEKLHRKGDLEKEQNKAISVNCNRESDKMEDNQIQFINKIAVLTFRVLSETLYKYDFELRNKKLI